MLVINSTTCFVYYINVYDALIFALCGLLHVVENDVNFNVVKSLRLRGKLLVCIM